MNDLFKKKQKKGINPVVAAVAGVAVGVGAAALASNALKDKKNKKRVDDFVSDVKDKASDMKDMASGYFEKAKEEPEVKKAVKNAKK